MPITRYRTCVRTHVRTYARTYLRICAAPFGSSRRSMGFKVPSTQSRRRIVGPNDGPCWVQPGRPLDVGNELIRYTPQASSQAHAKAETEEKDEDRFEKAGGLMATACEGYVDASSQGENTEGVQVTMLQPPWHRSTFDAPRDSPEDPLRAFNAPPRDAGGAFRGGIASSRFGEWPSTFQMTLETEDKDNWFVPGWRLALDGKRYTWAQFLNYYGPWAAHYWMYAPPCPKAKEEYEYFMRWFGGNLTKFTRRLPRRTRRIQAHLNSRMPWPGYIPLAWDDKW